MEPANPNMFVLCFLGTLVHRHSQVGQALKEQHVMQVLWPEARHKGDLPLERVGSDQPQQAHLLC